MLLAFAAVAIAEAGATARNSEAAEVASVAAPAELITTTTAAPSTTAPPSTTAAPTTTTTTEAPEPEFGPHETLVATATDEVNLLVAYSEPEGYIIPLPFIVPNPHQFGGPLTLRVTEGSIDDEWVKVALPVRPNGQEAWIPTENYTLSTTTIHAQVDLSNTSVKVFDGDELIVESQAAIGSPSTPTPLGTFYVAAVRENPPEESFLGPYALVLSGFSETLDTFSGGIPVIAIHGTNTPDGELGHAVSNGCLRVPNDVIQLLAEHVPPGAPVVISG